MAWFTYKCQEHGDFRASLPSRANTVKCRKCGLDSAPVVKAGTSVVYERLDNGAMARAVERMHDIEDLMDEHAGGPVENTDDEEENN